MIDTTTTYGGADWIRYDARKPLSEFGARCADLLGWWARGIYHLDQRALLRTDWSNERWIKINLPCWGGWSTFDNDSLTRLVIGAHDWAIRVEIQAIAPHLMEVMMHPRQREGSWSERHPTIEQAIERARQDR